MKRELFLYMFLLTSGCQSPSDNHLMTDCPTQKPAVGNRFSLVISDSIKTIVPDSALYLHRMFDVREAVNAYFGLAKSVRGLFLEQFELGNKYVRTVQLGPEFEGDICSLLVHSPDSIFFLKNDPFQLILTNHNGVVQKVWSLADAPLPGRYSEEYYFSTRNDQKPIVYGHTVYIPIMIMDYFSRKDRGKIPRFVSYDLTKNTWGQPFGIPSGMYQTDDKIDVPDDFAAPMLVRANDQLWVTFPLDHRIYRYDLTGTLLETICTGSKYLTGWLQPPGLDSDIQQQTNYLLTAPFFGPLHYHAEIALFSRVLFHETELQRPDGTLVQFSDRHRSIQYFDRNMNFLHEHLLDSKAGLFPGQYWVTGTGFVVSYIRSSGNLSENELSINTVLRITQTN